MQRQAPHPKPSESDRRYTSSGRRLLLISFYYPPSQVIGAVRGGFLAKHLTQLGWQVTVLTPDPKIWNVPELGSDRESKDIHTGTRFGWFWSWWRPSQKILSIALAIVRAGFQMTGLEIESLWASQARKATEKIPEGTFDLILATGGPWISFELARELSSRWQCRFVLDYRDPWNDNPQRLIPPIGARSRERTIFAEAAKVVAVLPSMAATLPATNDFDREVVVITNGFDEEELEEIEPFRFEKPAIVYAGSFYPPYRSPGPLFDVIAGASAEEYEFHYFGHQTELVRLTARSAGIEERVVIHGQVDRKTALSAIKGASLMTVVGVTTPNPVKGEQTILPAKIFEIIGLKKPYIVIGARRTDIDTVIEKAGGGRRFVPGDPGAGMFASDVLNGHSPPFADASEFSWRSLARRYSDLLDRALS